MSIRFFGYVLLLAIAGFFVLGIQAQTDTPTPTVEGTPLIETWCYHFDFTDNDYDGQWVYLNGEQANGFGHISDEDGIIYGYFSLGQSFSNVDRIAVDFYGNPSFSETGQSTLTISAFGLYASYDASPSAFFPIPSRYNGTANTLPLDTGASPQVDGQIILETTGDNTITDSAYIRFDGVAGGIDTFEIQGNGENPFGVSNCAYIGNLGSGGGSGSGGGGGSNPTSQPLPTNTPTSTPTLIPTSTPDNSWCYQWDFTVSDGGWVVSDNSGNAQGSYTANGWESAINGSNNNPHLYIEVNFTDTFVNSWQIDVAYVNNANEAVSDNQTLVNRLDGSQVGTNTNYPNWGSTGTTATLFHTANATLDELYFVAAHDDSASVIRATGAQAEGQGTNPFGENNCNVPTPTPSGDTPTPDLSPTPTLTPTSGGEGGSSSGSGGIFLTPFATSTVSLTQTQSPTYEEQCIFENASFTSDSDGWITTGDSVLGAIVMSDGDTLEQEITIPSGDYTLEIVSEPVLTDDDTTAGNVQLDYNMYNDSEVEVDSVVFGVSDAAYDNYGGQYTSDTDLTVSESPLTFELTVNITGTTISAVRILSVCISEGGENTGNDGELGNGIFTYSCGQPITPPPLSILKIGQWIVFLARVLLQWFQCQLLPFLSLILNALIQFFLTATNFFNWIISTFVALLNWIFSQLFPFIGKWLVNFVAFLLSGFSSFVNRGVRIILIGGLLLELLTELLQLVLMLTIRAFNWGRFALIDMVLVFIEWGFQSPQDVGFPIHDCTNYPLQSDICAMFYIAEHTIFSGVGQYIVPLLSAIFGVVQFFFMIDMFLKFIGKAKE